MVITRIRGGLGNQLFQYAFGKYLAIISHQNLKCDISWFTLNRLLKVSTPAEFELSKLALDELKTTTVAEVLKNEFIRLTGSRQRFLGKITVLKDKDLKYTEPIDKELIMTKNVYLDGYWQSYRYLEHIRDVILREFVPKDHSRKRVDQIHDKLTKKNLVAVHFRRGDYLSNAKSRTIYTECSTYYYYTAMKIIARSISNPLFLVFSNDIEWVIRNVFFEYPVIFVEEKWDLTSIETLYLMSLCDHFIVANSTFSWWGAWLSKNQDKLVFAPERWYLDNSVILNDLIPEQWMTL